MNPAVVASYDMFYVALSFAISFLGSLVALSASHRIVQSDGQLNRFDLISATLALGGIGVWTMHFIGMLALKLDLMVGYALPQTLLSLLAICLATGLSLAWVARAPKVPARLLAAGLALGLGVGLMHYLGMYGMRFGGYIRWSYPLVALSLLIAVLAATAALWLAFNTRHVVWRVLAALVMAGAICSMHYTGMAAADFVCTTADRLAAPTGLGVIVSDHLDKMVLTTALIIALVLSIDLAAQKLMSAPDER